MSAAQILTLPLISINLEHVLYYEMTENLLGYDSDRTTFYFTNDVTKEVKIEIAKVNEMVRELAAYDNDESSDGGSNGSE